MRENVSIRKGNESTRDLAADIEQIARFVGTDLASTVAELESKFAHRDKDQILTELNKSSISGALVKAAHSVKGAAGQINVVIHALGILTCLPAILENGEVVESLSLGAGSSAEKRFDLETNRRVAEFTFITWRGNDNMRLQKVFKDFYRLVEFKTDKAKQLWLSDNTHVRKFLSGGTSLRSATHGQRNTWESLRDRYPSIKTVGEYYQFHSGDVSLRTLPAFPTTEYNG